MTETLTLSRYRLATFLACQRRFQLRYLRRLSWPAAPLDERLETIRTRGEAFHRLLERHFLGLPISPETIADVEVRRWFSLFQNSGLQLPAGERFPESRLTIPVNEHFLNGRFDLLIRHDNVAHIFDWKTGRPQTVANLRRDWQTRLYLAMLAESGQALGQQLDPDQIAITYWYVNDPAAPRTIQYNQTWHKQNWTDIQEIVAQIDAQLAQDEWPLTDDLALCRPCAYRSYCDRQDQDTERTITEESEEEIRETDLFLEPNLP
ncbi:MAG: PD-(D/E)XK nuclease family protein [Chloroflexi bacterium]|nr:PD-(D/E)XK nuclease family protein [Chloroflexota bacterium]